jgi:hypothetical protein
MKFNITITEAELLNTVNTVCVDPCTDIECTGIDCDNCPLQVAAEECRKAQGKFISILKSFSVEE